MTKTTNKSDSPIKQLINNLESVGSADSPAYIQINQPGATKPLSLHSHMLAIGVPHKYVFKHKQLGATTDPLESRLNAYLRAAVIQFIVKQLHFDDEWLKQAYEKELSGLKQRGEKR